MGASKRGYKLRRLEDLSVDELVDELRVCPQPLLVHFCQVAGIAPEHRKPDQEQQQ